MQAGIRTPTKERRNKMSPLHNATPPPDDSQDFIQLKDQMGKILVILPNEKDTITTVHGESDVIRSDIYVYNGKSFDDLGEMLVFWARLRKQLEAFVGTGDSIVGTLLPAGRSYALVDLEPAVLAKVSAAWDALESF
jgi:hypothetical protein